MSRRPALPLPPCLPRQTRHFLRATYFALGAEPDPLIRLLDLRGGSGGGGAALASAGGASGVGGAGGAGSTLALT